MVLSLSMLVLSKHPTRPPTPSRTLALLADDIHLITLLDKLVGTELGDDLCLLDVGPCDEFALLEPAGVFEQLVLEGVVDVFLDDDVFVVALKRRENRGIG